MALQVAGDEQAVVTQPDEVLGQDVLQETADELVVDQRDEFVVATDEGHVLAVDTPQPIVAQPDSVSLAAEVGTDVLETTERGLA